MISLGGWDTAVVGRQLVRHRQWCLKGTDKFTEKDFR